MAISYPTDYDDATNLPEPTTGQTIPAVADANRSLAIRELEAKLGKGASNAADATTGQVPTKQADGTTIWADPEVAEGTGTDLTSTPSTTEVVIASSTGNDATIAAVGANAGVMTAAMKTKHDGIEAGADVTDATNVAAAGATMDADTSLAGNGYFLDEDDMVSNSATKVPSQQSVKAYVDAEVAGVDTGTVDTVVAGTNIDVDATDPANPIVSVEALAAADITDFDTAADARISNAAGSSIASLSGGKVPSSQLPAVSLTSVQTAVDEAAQLALTTEEGDVVVRTDENKTYMHNGGTAGTMADFTLLNTPADAVTSVNGSTGVVVLDHTDVGAAEDTHTHLLAAGATDVTATPTELNYVGGVTSAIQTQLDAKAADADVVHDTGDETIAGVKTFSSDPIIPDEAYDATAWNGSLEPATKNAIRDKFESLSGGGQTLVTHIVAASGGTHTTLGAAIAAASSGDTIYVREGTYSESAISTSLTNLTIIGENPKSSVISMGANDITFTGDYLNLINLGFTGTGQFKINCSYALMQGCIYTTSRTTGQAFYHEQASNIGRSRFIGNHFHATHTANARLYNLRSRYSVFSGNFFYFGGNSDNPSFGCIEIEKPTIFTNNALFFNATATTGTVAVMCSSSLNEEGTIISGNHVQGAATYRLVAFGLNGDFVVLSNNTATQCLGGVTIGSSGTENVVSNNNFTMAAGASGDYGININATSHDNVITGNRLVGGGGSSTNGVNVENGSDNNIISNNRMKGWAIGVNIVGSSSLKNQITDNVLISNTTAIVDAGVGTTINNNGEATILFEKQHVLMKNTSGGTLTAGTVVVFKAVAAGNEITTTTTAGDNKVFGMVAESIANNASGLIQTLGKTVSLKADGTTDIAAGDYLATFTTAGVAAKASTGQMAFAIALEAYTTDDGNGVLDALLITPRLI